MCRQERHPEARHRRPPLERHQHRIARSGSNPAQTNTLCLHVAHPVFEPSRVDRFGAAPKPAFGATPGATPAFGAAAGAAPAFGAGTYIHARTHTAEPAHLRTLLLYSHLPFFPLPLPLPAPTPFGATPGAVSITHTTHATLSPPLSPPNPLLPSHRLPLPRPALARPRRRRSLGRRQAPPPPLEPHQRRLVRHQQAALRRPPLVPHQRRLGPLPSRRSARLRRHLARQLPARPRPLYLAVLPALQPRVSSAPLPQQRRPQRRSLAACRLRLHPVASAWAVSAEAPLVPPG